MNISRMHIDGEDPLAALMPHLEGRVFHVTKECYWTDVYASAEICPNIHGKLKTTFGRSTNSYFKNLGCVSVFDYRNIYEEEPQKHIKSCRPTLPLTADSGIAILFLSPNIYPELQSYEGWKKGNQSQMIVPHIEAGHSGPIPLSLVEKVTIVTISENANSMAARLERRIAEHEFDRADSNI